MMPPLTLERYVSGGSYHIPIQLSYLVFAEDTIIIKDSDGLMFNQVVTHCSCCARYGFIA